MDVYFYTGNYSHSLWRQQIKNPPNRISYIPSTPALLRDEIHKQFSHSARWTFRTVLRIKQGILPLLGLLGIPQVRYIKIPPCDLVHSRHVLLNRFPWLVDLEDVTAYAWYLRSALEKPWGRKILEQLFSSPYCRMILPWTNAARCSMENIMDCSTFRDKIRVMYPAIAPAGFNKKAKLKKRDVRILFVGSGFHAAGFYAKGGMEALLAFEKLSHKYPQVSFSMVAFVPAALKERYAGNLRFRFLARIPNEQLRKEFAEADVFVLPTHTDTFGFVFLEAFAHGVPCVGTEHFAVPEIITEGVTGFLVRPEHSYFGSDYLPLYPPARYDGHPLIELLKNPSDQYVESLTERLSFLIEDDKIRLTMSEAAYEQVVSGKFSFQRRNQAIKKVYEESLDKAK